jgi:hypothetical protein
VLGLEGGGGFALTYGWKDGRGVRMYHTVLPFSKNVESKRY